MKPSQPTMPSDSQNKLEKPDGNVVALHRAEFVASIEKKLAEARRFLSLHDYAACADLVEEVLSADPQNSKAKALLDLSSIKLAKRKLYKRIAEVSPLEEPVDSSGPAVTEPAQDAGYVDSQPALEQPNHQPEPAPAPAVSVTQPPLPRRRGSPDSPTGLPQDSMRERTISALVELLKSKETTLEDRKAPQSSATSSPPPPSMPTQTIEKPLGPPRHQPSPPHSQERPRSVLEANCDFVPGSLDELFEGPPQKPSLLPLTGRPEVQADVPIPKQVPPPAALTSPRGNSPEIKESRPASPAPLHIGPPGLPEVTAPVQPAHVQASPTLETESWKTLQSSPPLTPPPPPAPVPAIPSSPHVIQLPDVRIFDQITAPRPLGHQDQIERKAEQRSDELRNSELQAGAIAQIKKYLYQEEYDLCARDLAMIRDMYRQNAEIQTFVENTSRRLVELQRIKKFEIQAKDLMASAVAFYQEGKREEALIAVREILRVNPNHVQAREFVSFVERHQGKDARKQPAIQKVRACRSCGSEVDAVSQFCSHCGKRLL